MNRFDQKNIKEIYLQIINTKSTFIKKIARKKIFSNLMEKNTKKR
jgi:hypothetical protein